MKRSSRQFLTRERIHLQQGSLNRKSRTKRKALFLATQKVKAGLTGSRRNLETTFLEPKAERELYQEPKERR